MSGWIKPLVATSEEQIGDAMPRPRQSGKGRAAEELRVVRVGEDHEDVLGGGPIVREGIV